MHWIQRRSVSFYFTNIGRQLYQPPAAEYLILQMQILSGGDIFANLVQWASLVGSLISVSLIAQQLGSGKLGILAATFAAGTLPMALAQASSTQNDLVVTFFLLVLIHLTLGLREGHKRFVLLGTTLGLTVLTKGTAYILAAPIVGLASWQAFRLHGWRATKGLALVGVIAIGLNLGHYARSWMFFGAPLGNEGYAYENSRLGLDVTVSNLIRNAALHLASPSEPINEILERVILKIHKEIDLEINDEGTTWSGTRFSVTYSIHEDLGGNPLHFVLLAPAMLFFVLRPRKSPVTTQLALMLIAAFILFCFYLKWQPWHSRLHLPLFMAASPVLGLFLEQMRWSLVYLLILLALLASSFRPVLQNEMRPLIGEGSLLMAPRLSTYFVARPQLELEYREATEFVKSLSPRRVGVALGGNDWEYPLWVLLDAQDGSPQLEHMDANLYPADAPPRKMAASVIICTDCQDQNLNFYQGPEFVVEFGSTKVVAPTPSP
jgi:hypothetical protein